MHFGCPAVTRPSVNPVSRVFTNPRINTMGSHGLGQTALPESCPVCAHAPLDATLCKPNKALRTTLKAFLRTEEKKRERERPSSKAVESPAPALTPTPAPTEPPSEEPTPPIIEPQQPNGASEQSASQTFENHIVGDAPAEEEKPEPAGTESSSVDPVAQQETPTSEPVSSPDIGSLGYSRSNMPPQHDTTNTQSDHAETVDQPNPSEPPAQSPRDEAQTTEGDANGAQDAPQTDQSLTDGVSMDPNNPTALQPMGWQGPVDVNQMMPFMANGMPMGGMMPFPNQMGKLALKGPQRSLLGSTL